jgi:hypothetical protein
LGKGLIHPFEGQKALFGIYRDGILLPGITNLNLSEPETIGVQGAFPRPLVRINLPGHRTPATNVARTTLKEKKNSWAKPIWVAVENALSNDVSKKLDLPPVERLFCVGWLAAVFRLSNESLRRLIPDSKAPTLWLVSGASIEIKEAKLVDGEEVPIVPNEIGCVAKMLTQSLFSQKSICNIHGFHWDGPDSLVESIDFHISVPFSVALDWSRSCIFRRLGIARLQLLQPPEGISKLLEQFVCVAHEELKVPDRHEQANDADSLMKQRRKMLCTPEVKNALALAQSNPASLQPKQRHLLSLVVAVHHQDSTVLPVAFSDPFSKCCVTQSGQLNLLHNYGQTVFRCLAACALAELDERVGSGLYRAVAALSESQMFRKFIDPTEQHNLLHKFESELFKLVTAYKLIDGFAAPARPSDEESIPSLANAGTSELPFRPWSREYELPMIKGHFGKIITKWPP